ncbi:hypothetical protein HYV74_02150 [Candidatus Uhrbacteria bacterium]|nr:hypothetical protein [Candidatus Uhrbacteria bacterium]
MHDRSLPFPAGVSGDGAEQRIPARLGELSHTLLRYPVHPRGHWMAMRWIVPNLYLAQEGLVTPMYLDALERALATPDQEASSIVLPRSLYPCVACGACVDWQFDRCGIVATSPCPRPHGSAGAPCVFVLNVPSGVLMVGEHFRPAFQISASYDCTTPAGCVRTSHAMAEVGCASVFVGDTYPSLYRGTGGALVVGFPWHDVTTDRSVFPADELVRGSITSEHWCAMVDGDEFMRRGCADVEQCSAFRVQVRPGVYMFTHELPFGGEDRRSRGIMTRIQWVRPPDPVRVA